MSITVGKGPSKQVPEGHPLRQGTHNSGKTTAVISTMTTAPVGRVVAMLFSRKHALSSATVNCWLVLASAMSAVVMRAAAGCWEARAYAALLTAYWRSLGI
jgi:hypothetical protein